MLDKVLELNKKTRMFDIINIEYVPGYAKDSHPDFYEKPEEFYVFQKYIEDTSCISLDRPIEKEFFRKKVATLKVIHKDDLNKIMGSAHTDLFGRVPYQLIKNEMNAWEKGDKSITVLEPKNLNGYETHDPDFIYTEPMILFRFTPNCAIKYHDWKREYFQGQTIYVTFGERSKEKYRESAFWLATNVPDCQLKFCASRVSESHRKQKMLLMGMRKLDDNSIKGWGFVEDWADFEDTPVKKYFLLEFYTRDGDQYCPISDSYSVQSDVRFRNNLRKQGILFTIVISFFLIGLFDISWVIWALICIGGIMLWSGEDENNIRLQRFKNEDFFNGHHGYDWMKNSEYAWRK